VSRRLRWPGGAAALVLVALTAGGCGSDGAGAGANAVQVKITEAGCEPAELEIEAGPTTFEVTNDGADEVNEFEVLDGERILGEAENLAPGLSGSFSLTLEPGEYQTYCPGGTTQERGTLTVTGAAGGSSSSAEADAAMETYLAYVSEQTALQVQATEAFVAALASGDLEAAKAAYVPARIPYERIEPIAESFGDLDPAIDAREGDVPAEEWTGFHPIEKLLWIAGTTDGTEELGRKLLADVKSLQTKAATIELEPAQIANGAVELLGEVSASKITGEEERYSRIDLVDFEANVEGAQAAFDAVKPLLAAGEADLVAEIETEFAAVMQALDAYREGDGFVPYTELEESDTRALSQAIDALAEPLSRVSGLIVAGR
jgi:iron uptake system component EfeO